MKKILRVSFLLGGLTSAFSQGLLDWGNNFTGLFRAPEYRYDPSNPTIVTNGPPGNVTVYDGPLVQGTRYTFGVFIGPSSVSDPNALFLLVSTTFRTANGNVLPAGLVNGG